MGRRTRAAAVARQSPQGRRRAREQALQRARGGAKFGSLAGAVFAGLAILIGVGRVVLARLGGRHVALPMTWQDARVIAAYVVTFVLGGALVGAVHSAFERRAVTAIAFMAAGTLVMNAIAYTNGQPGDYRRVDLLWMTAIGCVFGLAAAYGAARKH